MTVEDNIRSVLEFTDMTPAEQKDKLESLIDEFGLHKVRLNTGDRLSGSERRRAEIACCLAIRPEVCVLDEPFAGIDLYCRSGYPVDCGSVEYRNIGILITDICE